MEERYFPRLQVGDSVGGIYKRSINPDGTVCWSLLESKITKVVQTKKEGWRYYTKSNFVPLYAEDIDNNTEIMEDAVGKGYILTKEVFGLNDVTRPFAEKWIEWANENKDKAVSVLEANSKDTEEPEME